MTQAEKENLYFQFLPMARKVAGKLSRAHSRDYEEIADIAEYVLALEVFGDERIDKSKSGWSTYLYYRIYWFLKEVITRGRYPRTDEITDVDPRQCVEDLQERDTTPTRSSWIDDLRQELSEEGAALLRIICEAPEELKAGISPRAPARSKSMVHDYLIDVLDWDDFKFQQAWDEIESAIAC